MTQDDHDAQEMDVDGSAQQAEQRNPLAELTQTGAPEAGGAASVEGEGAQPGPEVDEQVSDTDNEDEGKHYPYQHRFIAQSP